MTTATHTPARLKGEGEVKYVKRTRCRRECDVCGEPANFRLSFLLKNSRSNPASSGYRGDDISWCSDAERFVCSEHKENLTAPDHHEWAGTFNLERIPHMGLHWVETEITPEGLGSHS